MKIIILVDTDGDSTAPYEVDAKTLKHIRKLLEGEPHPLCRRCGTAVLPDTNYLPDGWNGVRHAMCPNK